MINPCRFFIKIIPLLHLLYFAMIHVQFYSYGLVNYYFLMALRNLFPKDDHPNTSSLTLNIPLTIFLHSYLLNASTFHLYLIWQGNLNANEYDLYLQLLSVFVYLNYHKSDGFTPCIVFGYHLVKLIKIFCTPY